MARMPLIIFKNSVLASILSVIGSCMLMVGLIMLFQDVWVGIILLAVAASMILLGYRISEDKRYNQLIDDLEKKGLLQHLPNDIGLCLAVYRSYPSKATLKLIEGYNPTAAAEIRRILEQIQNNGKNK